MLVQIPGAYCCYNDEKLTFCDMPVGVAALLGYSPEEIHTQYDNSLWELVLAEERTALQQKLKEQLDAGDEIELIFSACHKNGENIWLMNRGYRVVCDDGREYISGMLIDITKDKDIYDRQAKTLEKYQIILSQTENIIFEWDYVADTIFFSDTWESIFGYTPETEHFSEVLESGKHFYPGDNLRLEEQLKAICQGTSYQIVEIRIMQADGEYLWCRVRATGVYDANGALCKIVGIIIDIDEEKRAADALQAQAERDSLTKLFNAYTTRKKAEEYLAAEAEANDCALLIIDVDNFKQVNDRFGHMFGDMVLTQVAQTIRKLFRSKDIVGRIGGDEFMVLMKNVSDRELVNKRCSQLLEAFHDISCSQMYGRELSCSIGVAFAPVHAKEYCDLFKCADQALYHAKDLGKSRYSIFDGENVMKEG